jgi:hypothetical protein
MKTKAFSKKLYLYVVVPLSLMLTVQCPLFGPEPGDPTFPAPIDQGDSAAVRAILDLNKLKNIDVRKVINPFTKGRIAMLEFDSLGIDTFTFSSDLEKLDSLNSINLSSNNISIINVFDSLRFHQLELRLENNSFTTFPIGILKLKGVSNISILYNKITSLPPELIHTGIPNVYIDHNKLCSLTDSNIVAWLDTTYGDWKSRQDCP